ncbi:tripartite tricarboxylate transporter TctB family protein [Chengkuizengella axinellae]|uniref:Tripartite tricarboxylate transporter TctB family protein n=1 Tax=Chengkuizengella axinellae TaxID=3064388 RepID=A0ABT9J428_9BACL|nr:tripartite tricarboxylate transporter TctB family protein [Chengkuizengella sp. 2205SS18-9]MDP5276223.1 tripartite tricarboxylate transporter TctB family protein [Chengkuizengella sp. 2205SS18-9]
MLNSMNRKVSIVIFLFSMFYLLFSYQIEPSPFAKIDADIMPKGLGYLLLVLSVLLFIENKEETEQEKAKRNISKKEISLLLLIVLFVLLYILLLEAIGFIIVTILFLTATSRLLGYTNWIRMLIVFVTFTLVIYFSFNELLGLSLPSGILPF